MAEINTPLNAAEQTLAFALTWIAAEPVYHVKDTQLALNLLDDVLPYVDRDHPIIAPMAMAAEALVSIGGPGQQARGTTWAQVMFDANRAIAGFAKWRAGRSYEAFQNQRKGKA